MSGSRSKAPPRTKLLSKGLAAPQLPAEARRQAACVLEVLAGLRTPQQAASALGLSVPTYYNLETRALRGLVYACTPDPPGRAMVLGRKLSAAEGRCAVLEKQVQRYQALLRAAQRSAGLLPPPAPPPRRDAAGRRRKPGKPRVRALRAIEALHEEPGAAAAPGAPVTVEA